MNTKQKKLIPDNRAVIVQGITGKEGMRGTLGMLTYGTPVLAGVTPGKGGSVVHGVPVFNTMREALLASGPIGAVVQFVPPLASLSATREALDAGVSLIHVGAEGVPVQDAIIMHQHAEKMGAILMGPGSVGMIVPRLHYKLGMIGGGNPSRVFTEGNIAVISKSGGMTSEVGLLLKQHGFGVSLAMGAGGEKIIGSDFADILQLLEHDDATIATVIFGEVGGSHEERLAEYIHAGRITKPVIAFIAGEFIATLDVDAPFGHAGALLERGRGTAQEKREVLGGAGVHIARTFDEIPKLLALCNNA